MEFRERWKGKRILHTIRCKSKVCVLKTVEKWKEEGEGVRENVQRD
jgi:hypothetical protein